jgi:hypothetical protein
MVSLILGFDHQHAIGFLVNRQGRAFQQQAQRIDRFVVPMHWVRDNSPHLFRCEQDLHRRLTPKFQQGLGGLFRIDVKWLRACRRRRAHERESQDNSES